MLVFLDIETSGLDPNVHGILEIYARTLGGTIFSRCIFPDNYVWDDVALTMHLQNGLLTECRTSGAKLAAVLRDFEEWLRCLGRGYPVTLVGKAVDRFDKPFLLHAAPSLAGYMHRNSLDIGSLLFHPVIGRIQTLAELCALHGITTPVHRAEADVLACIALYAIAFNVTT